jgi:hypothetical protein
MHQARKFKNPSGIMENNTSCSEVVKKFRKTARKSSLSRLLRPASNPADARLKLLFAYSIVALVCTLLSMRYWKRRVSRRKAMRKVLILVLLSFFFAAACSKSEETPAAPEASAAADASPAAAASPAEAAPAAPAASPS